jgi:integrase
VLDKRIKTWNFYWWENGKRHSKKIGSQSQYPTKSAAWAAAKPLRDAVEQHQPDYISSRTATVSALVEQYRGEKMPQRYATRRSYDVWLRLYVVPQWGAHRLTDLQARPVELWLQSLPLSPRSKTGIRMMLNLLWDYAMWRGDVPTQRNPMELVTVKGSSKRMQKPRSLTAEEFQRFVQHLEQPFRTIALVSVSFGLRISECLALKWSDVDWLNAKLHIRRGIVRQRIGDTKTEYSNRPLSIDAEMLQVLKVWKQSTQFAAPDDWVFASPVQIGRLPWSADAVNDAYLKAAKSAGIGHVSTHSMRHTYRSWLDAVGTPIAVQQKLMRHADIRTTMNVYGDVVTDEMAKAHSKVVGLALGAVNNR